MTDGAQGVGRVAGADSTGVFPEPCVQHIEAAVFDVPASAKAFEQECRIGFLTRQAGDSVRHGASHLSAFESLPFQSDQLLNARPIEITVVDEVRRGG